MVRNVSSSSVEKIATKKASSSNNKKHRFCTYDDDDDNDEDREIKAIVSTIMIGLPKGTVLKTKKKTKGCGYSIYNGVSNAKRVRTEDKFDAKFNGYHMGAYTLEVDAALAFDGSMRAHGWGKEYERINFATVQDYMMAQGINEHA